MILEAHRRAAREGRSDFTDDAALAEWAGLTVATFEGDPANMKLTTPEDFVREEARLASLLGDIRTGTGYDVHAFGDGDHVMICGIRVPHTRGFLAHSDGDVGLHALVDAILGALAFLNLLARSGMTRRKIEIAPVDSTRLCTLVDPMDDADRENSSTRTNRRWARADSCMR